MSDYNGKLEIRDSPASLWAAGTTYPGATFTARGLQGGDSYTVSGNTVTVTMQVTEPGDWIRVVTAVPEPSSMLLLGLGTLGAAASRLRRRKKAA